MIFFFRCFLLLAVSTFALYLSLCLYPDISKASWYGITESLKISAEDDNDESRDSMESGSCLIINGGWLGQQRVWIYSETRTWHDKNIQSNALYR